MTPAFTLDTQRLVTVANEYEREMLHFLRELSIPAMVWRIRLEMEKLGFEETEADPAGIVLGRIGSGRNTIVMEARADQSGAAGVASLVYAGKLIHELGMYGDFTFRARISAVPAKARGNGVLSAEPTNLRIYREAIPGSHPLLSAAIATYEALFELPPAVGKRNGHSGVPLVAFGPGNGESEDVALRQMVKAAQFYAALPAIYADMLRKR